MGDVTKIILRELCGELWVAHSPEELVMMMKRSDWSQPKTIEEYMSGVQGRIAVINEYTFTYWDCTSFLMGYAFATNARLSIHANGVKKDVQL